MFLRNVPRLLALSGLAALALSGLSARADNFTFSITNTIGTVSGTAYGQILGLTNNSTGAATQVLITGGPAGLNSIFTFPVDATSWDQQYQNSFTETNGVITAAAFWAQQTVGGFAQGAQLYIEGDGGPFNFVNVDGTDTYFVWGDDGPAGVTFSASAVPEPSSLLLMATGVLGAVGIARRKLKA